jgi:hypothetical protein
MRTEERTELRVKNKCNYITRENFDALIASAEDYGVDRSSVDKQRKSRVRKRLEMRRGLNSVLSTQSLFCYETNVSS